MDGSGTSRVKLNNNGLSLVELIVAISMGVIISGAIAALITFAIRMYRNESVNTEMQYELQSNLNMMMDEIMGASVFVIKQNGGVTITTPPDEPPKTPYTKYALFGNIYTPSGSTDKKIKGVIFVSSDPVAGDEDFKVYMDRFDEAFPGSYTDLKGFAAAKAGISGVQYLLGENVTQFVIRPQGGLTGAAPYEYTNPIDVGVKLSFAKKGWGEKKYQKHVDDVAYLRNRVTDSIYVDEGSGMIEYTLKKKDE